MKNNSLFIKGPKESTVSIGKLLFNTLLVAAVLTAIVQFSLFRIGHIPRWDQVWAYRTLFLKGFGMTILVSIFGLILSLTLGTLAALGNHSKILFFHYLSKFYVELIRGTPLLVQIVFFYYIIGTAFGVESKLIGGIIILSTFSGAYVSEIIRAGIESIENSQLETARALGLNRRQIYRLIIYPQVIRRVLPPLAGQFASIIKDSSLLSFIAVREFTKVTFEVTAINFATFESYFLLAVGYLLLTFPISLWTKRLERRFYYES
jgi:polar amino acid transport system permease protein